MLDEPYLTLSQLNRDIRSVIEDWLCDEYWVVAEVAEISPRGRRHCYLQLVEKAEEEVIAQARATIWSARTFLLDEFTAVTGETLKAGMEVLLRVRVRFHEVYGLSLDVTSLNPVYTLGGMARRKREVLEKLAEEDLVALNRNVPFPCVPQRIALITSPTAAGLGDFVIQLDHNPQGYRFSYALFPAAVQGSGAEESLIAALQEVRTRAEIFDVVVILRGGGSQVDLSCFDGYGLAAEIARCPLPVITGIGHEKDECVADVVAHMRAKTPTAAAEMLLERVRAFEDRLLALSGRALRGVRQSMEARRTALDVATYRLSAGVSQQVWIRRRALEVNARRFSDAVRSCLASCSEDLRAQAVRLQFQPAQALAREEARQVAGAQTLRLHVRLALERADNRLGGVERDIHHLDPVNTLRRGYSITRAQGRVVRDLGQVQAGLTLHTQVANGTIISTVESTEDGSGERTDIVHAGDGAVGGDRRADRSGRGGRRRSRRVGEAGGTAGAELSGAAAEHAGGGRAGAAGDGGDPDRVG